MPFPDVISYSGCIQACERSGEWQVALALLMETTPDVICRLF